MGQQQLLLIILGVIIVGIAVAVGITMFQDNAISANKDAVINDLVQLAAKAQQHYRKPTSLGGGGNSYTGIDSAGSLVSSAFHHNDNGIYVVTGGTTAITIVGYGRSQDQNGDYPAITMTVLPTGNVLGSWGTTNSLSGL
jgi:hypothetical protein